MQTYDDIVDEYSIDKILQEMSSLLCDVSDGFVDDGVVWYEFMYKLVSNINGYMLIDTVGLI